MSAKRKILVIEDEPDMAMGLRANLEFDGYAVITAPDGERGVVLAVGEKPSCILLDLMLPGIDGFETCRRIRKEGIRAPIIVLTARGQEIDKVRGLELGADDYVTKPFGLKELLARIRALLRRSSTAQGEVIVAGDLVIDRPTRRVRVRDDAVLLSAKEFELVAKLASDPYRVFTKEQLLREVWGYRALGRTRTLESHASRIRKKLCLTPEDRFVVNVWGVGYRMLD